MPRTLQEILDRCEELADFCERYDIDYSKMKDAAALGEVRRAFEASAEAELAVADAVARARADGHSWQSIGIMVCTSGEAARQRYGKPVPKR